MSHYVLRTGTYSMIKNKTILIAVHNGIIALDIKKQLSESGYNAKIVDPYDQIKINENLNHQFQLIILEKSFHSPIAQKMRVPAIYLSTDTEIEKYKHAGIRMMSMPFDNDELQNNVRIALDENERNNQFYD